MSSHIHEILDDVTLRVLRFHADPAMIRRDVVARAARRLAEAVGEIEIDPDWQPFIFRFYAVRERYPEIYAHRTLYLWKWLQAAFQITSLQVPPEYFRETNSLKCRFLFLTILFDDICDAGKDEAMFRSSIHALEGTISAPHSLLHELIRDVWTSIQHDIRRAPNHLVLKTELDKAYLKWRHSLEYSIDIAMRPISSIRWNQHLDILSHSTTIYLAGLLDLLFVEPVSPGQIAALKQVFLRTQKMAQIGNWVTTWERELSHGDTTSGVVAFALQNEWTALGGLAPDMERLRLDIKKSPAESRLLGIWKKLRDDSQRLSEQMQMKPAEGYVDSFSTILFLQLASVGKT